tara:strand:+ start:64581 stop:67484 length:2904 start_codon:yes stop_codon:yes gene_type:complete
VKKEYLEVYQSRLLPKIAESLAWRQKSLKLDAIIKERVSKDTPMSSQETDDFFETAREYLSIRKPLFGIVNQFQYLVAPKAQTKVTLSEASVDKTTGDLTFILNPKDAKGRDTLFGLRMSLAAALVLYDNFLVGINPHYDNPAARKKLKFDTKPIYKSAFDEITKSFVDPDQRKMLARAMNLFAADNNLKNQYKIEVSKEEENLNTLILNSAFYNFMLKDGDLADPWSERWERRKRDLSDMTNYAARASTFAISFLFGNAAGAVKIENRDGYLSKLSNQEKNYIKSKLQPFDILLEKTPFRATDKFIPGYYGHVAVYLGSKEQLVSAGLWNYFRPEMKKQIEKGETILEALRYDPRKGLSRKALEGVQLNSLEHFLDIDELLVLRSVQPLTEDQKVMYAKNAAEQFGKPYDFNFDVNTKEKIVCSELAYVIFTDLSWPTAKSAGRHTISPDHVMAQAFPNKPLHPILMYDKNRELKEHSEKLDLAKELYRNIQGTYSSMVYKEESIYRRYMNDPQEIIHLSSGIAALEKRLQMIRSAKNTIDLEYFIYKADSDPAARILTQALIEKAKESSQADPSKNISVRVLIDASATVLKLKDDYATVLKENNIKVRYYNNEESPISNFMKVNQRNHRKSLVVDGKEAITGGRNIGSEYFDLSPEYNFLDTDIYIKGTMAQVLQESFEAYWHSPLSAEPLYVLPKGKNGKDDPSYKKKMQRAHSLIVPDPRDYAFKKTIESWGQKLLATQYKGVCTDSTFASDFPSDTKDSRRTFNTIKDIVSNAKQSLDIESPYFVITEKGKNIFGALLAIPGFKMSVQTNSLQSTDASYTVAALQPMVSQLTSAGINMYLYRGDAPNYIEYPTFQNREPATWGTHSKRAVVDGHTTLIGTYNVDPRSTNLNNEMVFVCHNNPGLAQNVLADMNARRNQSVLLGKDGLPIDKSNKFQGASTNKKIQYYLFKGIVKIPAFKQLL